MPLSQRLLQRRGVHSRPEVRACNAPGVPSSAPRGVDFADLPGTVKDAHFHLRSRWLQESSQTSESARRVCDKRARRCAQRRLSAQVSRTLRRRAKHRATLERIRSPWTQLQSRATEAGRSRPRTLPRAAAVPERNWILGSVWEKLNCFFGEEAHFKRSRALSGPIIPVLAPRFRTTRQQLPAPEKPTHDRDAPQINVLCPSLPPRDFRPPGPAADPWGRRPTRCRAWAPRVCFSPHARGAHARACSRERMCALTGGCLRSNSRSKSPATRKSPRGKSPAPKTPSKAPPKSPGRGKTMRCGAAERVASGTRALPAQLAYIHA